MWQKILDLLKASSFPDRGSVMLGLGVWGVLFFPEKVLSCIILDLGILVALIGMVLNREEGQYFISPCRPQILKEYYER